MLLTDNQGIENNGMVLVLYIPNVNTGITSDNFMNRLNSTR